jgi:hypothetical protein
MPTATELDTYKKNRISNLQKIYNTTLTRLNTELTQNIQKIINTPFLSLTTKNRRINELRNIYNINISNITNELNKNIALINNFVPKQIIINNNKNALLVGINYTGTPNKLYGCINDAINIKDRLESKRFNNITVLTDLTPKKATRVNIISEFTNLLKNSKEGDLLFFSYSGHGSYVLDKNGDEKTGLDQVIIPCDLQRIIDDELKNIIQSNLLENRTLFAIFDSCFSGSVLDLKYQYMDSLNYDSYTENDKQLETLGNVFMISGCTDRQTSADAFIDGQSKGAMTWSLLKAIKDYETSKSSSPLTWRELVKNMRDLLKKNKYTQIPQFSCGKFEDIDKNIFI